ncbi:hypothetical protein CTAYLR_002635 [Chrysophaeum taylorii]|uniref:Sodium/calcium exchanger membrane region domain-containing protein n=1 Tax=Chrysophaeum taylorii TaxID=2483200 RepID=A0AAD7UBI0_9STRA|nr:hypothetical protein CTAYLR_002635 [Chrysophaeum taylorii]
MSSPSSSYNRRITDDDALTVACYRCASGALCVSLGVVCVWLAPIAASNGRRRSSTKTACENVEARVDRCEFVTEACGGVANLVDYLHAIYCGSSPRLGLALLSLWLVLLLSLLGTTADVFFVEQLEFISKRFRLADDVAGATLMAFGNGAPDVFTAWNAIENASDFSLVLAELLGAAIFITTVVLGSVVLCARGDCAVDAKPFARDAATLGLSVFSIAACVIDGRIQLVESAAIISLYVVYVVYVVSNRPPPEQPDADEPCDDDDTLEGGDTYYQSNVPSLRGVHWSAASTRFSKAVHVLEFPFSVLRHLSIPAATFEHWGQTRRRVAACSVFGAVFVVALDLVDAPSTLARRLLGLPVAIWLAILGAALAVLVLRSTANDRQPPRATKTTLVVSGFVAAVAWLDLLASEVVAVLESLGAAAGLSSAVLGVTLLAWGNCIGDVVADTAVSRAGNTKAAVASVFNSPLFSQILATGFAAGYYTLWHGALQINLDKEAIISFSTMALSLAATSIACVCGGSSKLPRPYAYFLFSIYALYVVLTLTLEFDTNTRTTEMMMTR